MMKMTMEILNLFEVYHQDVVVVVVIVFVVLDRPIVLIVQHHDHVFYMDYEMMDVYDRNV